MIPTNTTKKMAPSQNSRPKAAEGKAEHNQGSKYLETRAKRERKGKKKVKNKQKIVRVMRRKRVTKMQIT